MDPKKTKILKNVSLFLIGGTLGVYIGQYFPDMYYVKIR